MNFKLIKVPSDAPNWPVDFPIWEGARSIDDPAIATRTFDNVSASNTEADWKKITARCGASSATANVVVVGVKRIEYGANLPVDDPLYVRKDEDVTFIAIPDPEDASWPDKIYNYPSWSGATRDQNNFATAKRKFETTSTL